MAYTVLDGALGYVDLYTPDTAGPGPEFFAGANAGAYARTNFPGLELRGWDQNLGAGTFMFMKAGAAITPGMVCESTQAVTAGLRYDIAAQPWAGGANSGKLLCVALTTLASGQFGWFQVQGIAVTTVQGTPAAGNPVAWQASGVVSPTGVASKAMIGAQFVSAPAVTIGAGSTAVTLGATTALVQINRPIAQGPIT